MGLWNRSREYDVIRLKVPRPCTEWCQTSFAEISKSREALERRVGSLESQSAADHSLKELKLKLETTLAIFTECLKTNHAETCHCIIPETIRRLFIISYESVNQAIGSFTSLSAETPSGSNSPSATEDVPQGQLLKARLLAHDRKYSPWNGHGGNADVGVPPSVKHHG